REHAANRVLRDRIEPLDRLLELRERACAQRGDVLAARAIVRSLRQVVHQRERGRQRAQWFDQREQLPDRRSFLPRDVALRQRQDYAADLAQRLDRRQAALRLG